MPNPSSMLPGAATRGGSVLRVLKHIRPHLAPLTPNNTVSRKCAKDTVCQGAIPEGELILGKSRRPQTAQHI